MTDRSLAIGAGNMNAFEMILRVSQKIAQSDGITKVFFIGISPDPAEHGEPAE